MHPDQLDVKRSGLWVARIFVAATPQAHLQPFYSLSFCLVAIRGAKHGFRSRRSRVTSHALQISTRPSQKT